VLEVPFPRAGDRGEKPWADGHRGEDDQTGEKEDKENEAQLSGSDRRAPLKTNRTQTVRTECRARLRPSSLGFSPSFPA
jgi:hypothetical protein